MPFDVNRRTPTKVRARRDTFNIDEIPTKDAPERRDKLKHNNRWKALEHSQTKQRSQSRYRKSYPPDSLHVQAKEKPERQTKRSRSEEQRAKEKLRRQKVTDYILSSAVRHAVCFKSKNNSAAFSDSDSSDLNPCLSRSIFKMWKRGQLCDVAFHVEGRTYYTHKLVMATACEYFAQEQTKDTGVTEIHIPNITAATMETVLNYFYTSKISINDKNIHEILQVSHHLGIAEVTRLCVDYLGRVTLANAVRYMHIAHSFRLDGIVEKIKNFVHENFGTLINSESFLRTDFNVIYDILSSELLAQLGELLVFQACVNWIDFDRMERLKFTIALMSLIGFSKMTSHELASHVETVYFMNDIPECKEMLYSAYRYKALQDKLPTPSKHPSPRSHNQVPNIQCVSQSPSKCALNPEGYQYKQSTLQHCGDAISSSGEEDKRHRFKIPPLKRRETVTGIRPMSPADHVYHLTSSDVRSDTERETTTVSDADTKRSFVVHSNTSINRVKGSVKDFTERILKQGSSAENLSQKVHAASTGKHKISRDDLVKEFPETDGTPPKSSIVRLSSKAELIKRLSGQRILPDDNRGIIADFSKMSVGDSFPHGRNAHVLTANIAHPTKCQHTLRESELQMPGSRDNHCHNQILSAISLHQAQSVKPAHQSVKLESGFVASEPNGASVVARSNHETQAAECIGSRGVNSVEIDDQENNYAPSAHPSVESVRPSQVKLSVRKSRSNREVLNDTANAGKVASSVHLSNVHATSGHTCNAVRNSSESEFMEVLQRISKSSDRTGNSYHNYRHHKSVMHRRSNHESGCVSHQHAPHSHHLSLSPIRAEDPIIAADIPRPPTPRIIMIMGGVNPYHDCHTQSHESNSIQQFDPNLNSWSIRTHLPVAIHHFAVVQLEGKVYVTGGQLSHSEDVSPLQTCQCYDVRSDHWHSIPSLKTARCNHAAVHLNNVVYVLGGEDCRQMSLKSVEIYNSVSASWEFVAPLKDARTGLAAITHRGRIFAIGGMLDVDEKFLLDSVEVFDPRTGKWSFRFPLPISICGTSLAEVHGVIYMVGGYVMKDKEPLSLDSIFRYCDETDTWEGFDTLHVPRHNAIATTLDKLIYIIGGESTAAMGHALSNVECIDVEKESHVTGTAPLLAPAYGIAGCVFDPRC